MPFLFWIAIGAALGFIYMLLIGRSVAAIVEGGRWQSAALPVLLRIALAALIFGLAAGQGAVAVLTALLGFLAARSLRLRRLRMG